MKTRKVGDYFTKTHTSAPDRQEAGRRIGMPDDAPWPANRFNIFLAAF